MNNTLDSLITERKSKLSQRDIIDNEISLLDNEIASFYVYIKEHVRDRNGGKIIEIAKKLEVFYPFFANNEFENHDMEDLKEFIIGTSNRSEGETRGGYVETRFYIYDKETDTEISVLGDDIEMRIPKSAGLIGQ